MIIYGRNPVREAFRGRRTVQRVWGTKGAAKEQWPGRLEVVSDDDIERICGSPEHQGVCAEVTEFEYVEGSSLLAKPDALIIALDEITDPQNFGAICRTAECIGATGVVIGERRSVTVTPSACKASAGAIEHLQIAQVRNIADFLEEAKAAQAWCYGAAGEARTSYTQPDYTGKVVLVLGAEGRGLRPKVANHCDELVSLPMKGKIDSLNVSVAAGVLLYEIFRQRSL